MPEGQTEPIVIPGLLPDQAGIKLEISGEPFIISSETVSNQVTFDAENGIVRFFDAEGDLAAEYNKGETGLVDVRLLHDVCYYGREEINTFTKISLRTIELNGKPYDAIVGINAEGQETTLAAKMTTYSGEQVWTRISTTELGNNNGQMIIWINPDQDGAVQVNEKTAEVFRSRFFEVVRDGGQGVAINSMTDGKLTIEAPYAYYESGGSDVRWAETTLDMHDVEIRIFESPEEWQEFAHAYSEIAGKVFSSSFGRSGFGVYLTPKDGGGTLLILLNTQWDLAKENYWNGKFPLFTSSLKETRDSIEMNDLNLWPSLTVFAYRQEGKNAFIACWQTTGYPITDTQGSFDLLPPGFLENHSLNIP